MTPILSATLLRTQSDARLATLTRDGHERAFEAIVERYRRALHRYLRRMLPESRSEDALQQTFIKAWSSLGEGGAEVKDLKPWLYRIAHNTALDALKRSGYDYDELHESLQSPHATEGDHERRAVMRETLAGVAALPDRQREALLRVAVEGQSRAQVAHDLGLSDGAVRQLVHRARMTLRAAATAVTPLPLAAWAAAAREHHAPIAQRVAELAAGGGAASGAGVLLKGGAVIVAAGALAVGPSGLKPDDRASGDQTSAAAGAAAIASRVSGQPEGSGPQASSGKALGNRRAGSDSSARGRAVPRRGSDDSGASGADDRSGSGSHDASGEDRHGSDGGERSGSSGPGPSGDDHSGSGSGGGEEHSGPGPGGDGEDHSGPGSGGSGSSGSGSSGSGESGSGSSGSGSGGSGSGASGSGDGGSGSGSGISGSGSGLSGSGSSGSGGSGRRDGSPGDGRR